MKGRILHTEDVSERIGSPATTLRWWRHTGTGPKSFKIGRRVAYLEEDVDAWLQEQYDAEPDPAT